MAIPLRHVALASWEHPDTPDPRDQAEPNSALDHPDGGIGL